MESYMLMGKIYRGEYRVKCSPILKTEGRCHLKDSHWRDSGHEESKVGTHTSI